MTQYLKQKLPLLMIPGPVPIHQNVLQAMSLDGISHVDPIFINTFSNTLKNTRKVFECTQDYRSLVLSGSGTLGWDVVAANYHGSVLVISTGIFGHWFADCFKTYKWDVDTLSCKFGQSSLLDDIKQQLQKKKYDVVTITHVDTSTGVLQDIPSISSLVKSISNDTLVVVDGVCSIGAERLLMKEWNVDIAFTASQKAIGVPPGLMIMCLSPLALSLKKPAKSYYASLEKWIPIMDNYEMKKGSYFATPPVGLVIALEVALDLILQEGMEQRFIRHKEASDWFKQELTKKGYQIIGNANTLTCVSVEDPGKQISKCKENDVVIAGGLIQGEKYVRVGHMNLDLKERLAQVLNCF